MEILKREYAEMFAFLKRTKRLLIILLAAFAAITVVSYFVAAFLYQRDPAMVDSHIQSLVEMIGSKGLIDEKGNMDVFKLFFSNFYAVITSVSYGMIPFLFLPVLSLLLNASIIGFLLGIMTYTELGGVAELAAGIAPHGIFEIPALLLGVAFGLMSCWVITKILMRKAHGDELFELYAETARALVLAVVPLLLVAALVESYVTPLIMDILF